MTTLIDLPFDCVRSICTFLDLASRYFFRYTYRYVKRLIKRKYSKIFILEDAYRYSYIKYLNIFKDIGMKVLTRDCDHLPINSLPIIQWYFNNLSEEFDQIISYSLPSLLLKKTNNFDIVKYTLDRFSPELFMGRDRIYLRSISYLIIESQFRIKMFLPDDSPYNAIKLVKRVNHQKLFFHGCYHTIKYLDPLSPDSFLVEESVKNGNFSLANKFNTDNSIVTQLSKKWLERAHFPEYYSNGLVWFHMKGVLTTDQMMNHFEDAIRVTSSGGRSRLFYIKILQYAIQNGFIPQKDLFIMTNWKFCTDITSVRFFVNRGVDPDISGFMINRFSEIAQMDLLALGFQ